MAKKLLKHLSAFFRDGEISLISAHQSIGRGLDRIFVQNRNLCLKPMKRANQLFANPGRTARNDNMAASKFVILLW